MCVRLSQQVVASKSYNLQCIHEGVHFALLILCNNDSIIQVVDSPVEVAEKADRIITMLPSSPNVIDVYTGPNGILK